MTEFTLTNYHIAMACHDVEIFFGCFHGERRILGIIPDNFFTPFTEGNSGIGYCDFRGY